MTLNGLAYREAGLCRPKELELMQATQRCFSVDTCKLRDFTNPHNGGINTIELDQVNSRYLLTGGGKGTISIYDTWVFSSTPRYQYDAICSVPTVYKHKFSVETVQWYPFDNGLFTSSSSDKELKIWDSNVLVPAETYEFNGVIYSHHMSPCATEHNLIAVGTSSSQAKLIDMRTGSSIQILKGHNKSIICVQWSPCLPFVVSTGSQDGRILFWDIRMAKGQMLSLDQHNGKKSGGSAHTGEVLALAFTETGYQLVSYGSDDTVRLWDTFTGKNELVNYGKVYNDVCRCLKIAISSNTHDRVLYIPEGETIKCFDLNTGHMIKRLSGHFRQINCCYYNPTNQELYSGSNDRNLLIWTPDHLAEENYLEDLELTKASKPLSQLPNHHNSSPILTTEPVGNNGTTAAEVVSSQSQTLSSVLADTWSDDEDD